MRTKDRKPAASRFSIVQGDITTFAVDAIVNAANTSLLGGGGVDGAIHRAAGPELLEECRTWAACHRPGKAHPAVTGFLPFRAPYAGARLERRRRRRGISVKKLLRKRLKLAADHGCKSVAFPSISTGIYGFPLEKAAPIAVGTILRFLEDHQDMEVQMVCFDGRTRNAYEEAFKDWG